MKGFSLYQSEALVALKQLKDNTAAAVVSDLPYGTTQCTWDSIIPLELLWPELKRVVKPGGAFVFTAAQPFTSVLVHSNIKQFRYDWTWVKQQGRNHLNAKIMPMRNKEDILVFCDKTPVYHPQKRQGFQPYAKTHTRPQSQNIYGAHGSHRNPETKGERFPLQTLYFNTPISPIHPTQKPIELMEYLILTHTNPNDIVLDCTMGSGQTMLACQNTNRRGIGIDNGYCRKKGSVYFGWPWKKVVIERLRENQRARGNLLWNQ